MNMKDEQKKEQSAYITYDMLFWLFLIGSVAGVIIEGVFTLAATVLELISGLLLRYGLGMRAWNYEHKFLDYKGLICLSFSAMWGVAAFVICKIYPYMNRMLDKMHGKFWHAACAVLTVVMVIDMSLTAVSIARWSGRHYGMGNH